MEGSNMPDKSMVKMTNQMYLNSYGITPLRMVGEHEYKRDPPPYEGPSIRGASFLPEAPSPAPITGTGVVMGDFLDERIDDLYTRIQKLETKKSHRDEIYNDMGILIYKGEMKDGKPHGIGIQYCQDSELILYEGEFKDGYRDGNGTLYWYNGGDFSGGSDGDIGTGENTLLVGSFRRGLFDGNIKMIKTKNSQPDKEFLYQRGKNVEAMKSGKTPEISVKPMKKFDYKTSGFVTIKKADAYPYDNRPFGVGPESRDLSGLKKYIKENKIPGMVWCPENKWGSPRIQPESHEDLFKNINESKTGWICDTIISPGCPLKLIKEKIDEGYTIEFEDENDKREVEAMQGGGYRRKNTRRKSRKRNTRRKSRKRSSRRRSKKK